MVKIKPFSVEKWMDDHELTAEYNIAETCCSSLSLQDLKSLSIDQSQEPISTAKKLTYGAIPGSKPLRSNIAKLYDESDSQLFSADDILITPGAIAANHLVLYTLIGPGDHVICHWPTYQQLYTVPESLGAEVDLWRASEEKGWLLDIEELKRMVKRNTKLIIINNPNNPTGATLLLSLLEQIIILARAHNITILSDEVYRPLFHSLPCTHPSPPPSIISLNYTKAIATGSLSKAFSLAGIRVGWIASRDPDILQACAEVRQYTNISVSSVDDQIASYALGPNVVQNLLARNTKLAKTNLAILDKFIEEHAGICRWVKPSAGTTAFVSFWREGLPVDDVVFCETLQKEVGVMFVPGSTCFGDEYAFKGFVRIGYACETDVLIDGLAKLDGFLRSNYGRIPLAT
ncbi:MAG: hypothetical protein M1812_006981 [Candelaria pacifica]|nr:MAG: hypothetical protein M1812_006981 [Candelaria pacifica]